ncbi:MAG: acyltransferase, partial [Actinomycetospora chiangmaiensis]|nr:acyltransferase [Actinomycetospora chiangmaiensis]
AVPAPALPETAAPPRAAESGAAYPRGHLPYLDGWRGLAILMVLAGHFFTIRGISVQRLGVELFFVLSGRLMADILFVRETALPLFYKRRISRVLPGFLVFVALIAAIPAAVPVVPVTWHDLAYALTFTSNYAPWLEGREVSIAFGHLWSLSVEEHAYLLLSVIALLHRRVGLPVIGTLLALSVVAVAIGFVDSRLLHEAHHAVYWRTDVRIPSILIPVMVYLTVAGRPAAVFGTGRAAALAPLAFGALGLFLNVSLVPDVVKYSAGTLCLALAVCTLEQAPAPVKRLLSFTPLRVTGLISFSLYLWQQPLFGLHLEHVASRWLLLPAAFGLAALSYLAVERPCRDWLNGRRWALPWSRRAAAGPAVGAGG